MSTTEEYVSKLIDLRRDDRIDPLNFILFKFMSWEASLQARLQENSVHVTPKLEEIVSEVLDEYVDVEDSRKIAELQLELTTKYADKLQLLDLEINTRVEEYLELYEEAMRRIIEEEEENGEPSEEEIN